MQRLVLVLVGCVFAGGLLMSASALADPPTSNYTGTKAVDQANQRVAQHQRDVERLQKDVGQQESASQQAAQRLQQQDRAIEQLRQQLKAAQQASKTSTSGH